jgi:hypothetical protein
VLGVPDGGAVWVSRDRGSRTIHCTQNAAARTKPFCRAAEVQVAGVNLLRKQLRFEQREPREAASSLGAILPDCRLRIRGDYASAFLSTPGLRTLLGDEPGESEGRGWIRNQPKKSLRLIPERVVRADPENVTEPAGTR